MKLAVLITWKPDADPATIAEFLRTAPDQLAAGPFVSYEHGVSMNPSPNPDKRTAKGALVADWGWIVEYADPDDSRKWAVSEAHLEMEAKLAPILGSMTVLSWQPTE